MNGTRQAMRDSSLRMPDAEREREEDGETHEEMGRIQGPAKIWQTLCPLGVKPESEFRDCSCACGHQVEQGRNTGTEAGNRVRR